MRDPNRIDAVLAELRAAWKANPDMRLTQLVYNAANCDSRSWSAVYQTEDDEVVEGLRGLVRREERAEVSAS